MSENQLNMLAFHQFTQILKSSTNMLGMCEKPKSRSSQIHCSAAYT